MLVYVAAAFSGELLLLALTTSDAHVQQVLCFFCMVRPAALLIPGEQGFSWDQQSLQKIMDNLAQFNSVTLAFHVMLARIVKV